MQELYMEDVSLDEASIVSLVHWENFLLSFVTKIAWSLFWFYINELMLQIDDFLTKGKGSWNDSGTKIHISPQLTSWH